MPQSQSPASELLMARGCSLQQLLLVYSLLARARKMAMGMPDACISCRSLQFNGALPPSWWWS